VIRSTPPTLKGKLPDALVANMAEGGAQKNALPNPQLAAAEEKLAELRVQDTDANPDVIQQTQIVNALKAAVQSTPAAAAPTKPVGRPDDSVTLANPAYEQEKMKQSVDGVLMTSLQQQLTQAQQKLAHMEQLARSAPEVQAQFENLDRGYNVLRKQYEELLSRRESSTITAAADTGADRVRLRVIDPPQTPIDPVAPNRLLLDSGVLVAGFGAAIGLAFLLSQTDQSVIDIAQLREFGIPVLGGLSIFHAVRRRRTYVQGMSIATALFILIVLYGGLMIHYLPHSKDVL
jgi:uncharacterized protein involved in exopolysaccharide biosynthesis